MGQLTFSLNHRRAMTLMPSFLLLALGVLGNQYGWQMTFGVDILFGSVATLLAIALYGTWIGLIATGLAALVTVSLWNHGFAALALMGEGLFVVLFLKKFRQNLAMASGTFWIFLGIPQVLITYHLGLGFDLPMALMVALKQASNGLINAVVASMIYSYWPVLVGFFSGSKARISVFQNIFNVFVAAALVPTLFVFVLSAQDNKLRVENTQKNRIDLIATGLSVTVERWRREHINAVLAMADLASSHSLQDQVQLQQFVELGRRVWGDFLGAFITDLKGTTVVFDPLVNALGQKTIGLNFADREYFQAIRRGDPIHVSKIFMARGGVFEPVVNFAAPVKSQNTLKGVVVASANPQQLGELLGTMPGESGYEATLVDTEDVVIASTNAANSPLSRFDLERFKMASDGSYRRWLREGEMVPPIIQWENSSMGRLIEIPGTVKWKLYVDAPMQPLQPALYSRYTRDFSFLLVLVTLILIGSAVVANAIAKPLSRLSEESHNLPEKLILGQGIRWPQSRLIEISALVRNFRQTVEALRKMVSDLKSSQDQLQKAKELAETASHLKSAFLANMSHEIRTPLGVVLGFANLLGDEDTTLEERRSFVSAIQRNGDHLALLIDDILDLSKVESGYLKVERIGFSVGSLLDQITSDHRLKAEAKGLYLKLENLVPESQDQMISDPLRFKQILSNLLGNAVKFTSLGGVTVRAYVKDSRILIDIADTGPGIDADYQQRLFQPFTQSDNSMTRRFGGTGLGLALSKRLAQLLGGDLVLQQSSPGQGSTFRFIVEREMAPSAESDPSEFVTHPEAVL
jgi:signal transduction histidine kinase